MTNIFGDLSGGLGEAVLSTDHIVHRTLQVIAIPFELRFTVGTAILVTVMATLVASRVGIIRAFAHAPGSARRI
jgi:ABC-type antimicrobial peptide transport system permease subunit